MSRVPAEVEKNIKNAAADVRKRGNGLFFCTKKTSVKTEALAEREGFEPSEPLGSRLFESRTFSHSDISPVQVILYNEFRKKTSENILRQKKRDSLGSLLEKETIWRPSGTILSRHFRQGRDWVSAFSYRVPSLTVWLLCLCVPGHTGSP